MQIKKLKLENYYHKDIGMHYCSGMVDFVGTGFKRITVKDTTHYGAISKCLKELCQR